MSPLIIQFLENTFKISLGNLGTISILEERNIYLGIGNRLSRRDLNGVLNPRVSCPVNTLRLGPGFISCVEAFGFVN